MIIKKVINYFNTIISYDDIDAKIKEDQTLEEYRYPVLVRTNYIPSNENKNYGYYYCIDVIAWCLNNGINNFKLGSIKWYNNAVHQYIYFRNEEDALAIKLKCTI